LKNVLLDFFNGSTAQEIITILECVASGGYAATKFVLMIAGYFQKVTEISEGLAAGGVGVIIPITELVIGLICSTEDFLTAINYFITALEYTDVPNSCNYTGQFVGGMIFTLGDS